MTLLLQQRVAHGLDVDDVVSEEAPGETPRNENKTQAEATAATRVGSAASLEASLLSHQSRGIYGMHAAVVVAAAVPLANWTRVLFLIFFAKSFF